MDFMHELLQPVVHAIISIYEYKYIYIYVYIYIADSKPQV